MADDAEAWVIERRATTASTNEDAQQKLGDPSAAGLAIVADVQTAGAGRRGRRWIAPKGSGLLFTAILPAEIPASAAWAATLWAGLAVARALDEWHVATTLQWPNDLLVDDRKICGILCVSRIAGERAWIGCGVGVNVFRPERHPELEEVVPPPIFLSDIAVVRADAREQLLQAILSEFGARLGAFEQPESIARDWERRAGVPGARYRFRFEDGREVEGEALRIAPGGGLVVRATNGELRTIELADARVVR